MIPIKFEYNEKVKQWYLDLITLYLFDKRCADEKQKSKLQAEFQPMDDEVKRVGIADNFKEIILADYSKIKEIVWRIDTGEIDYDDSKFATAYKWYDKLVESKINMEVISKFGVRICPYCNKEYVNNRLTGSEAQLDHFYPRYKYKIFSVSLLNFVPSCYACNHLKKHERIGVSPHDKEYDFINAMKFTYVPKSIAPFTTGESDLDIEMKFCGEKANLLKENIICMQILESYELDRDYVSEQIRKKIMYSELKIQEFIEKFKDAEYTREEIITLLYGDSTHIENIGKRPLGKLTMDIVRELEE